MQGRGNDFVLGGGANVLICLVIAKFSRGGGHGLFHPIEIKSSGGGQ